MKKLAGIFCLVIKLRTPVWDYINLLRETWTPGFKNYNDEACTIPRDSRLLAPIECFPQTPRKLQRYYIEGLKGFHKLVPIMLRGEASRAADGNFASLAWTLLPT